MPMNSSALMKPLRPLSSARKRLYSTSICIWATAGGGGQQAGGVRAPGCKALRQLAAGAAVLARGGSWAGGWSLGAPGAAERGGEVALALAVLTRAVAVLDQVVHVVLGEPVAHDLVAAERADVLSRAWERCVQVCDA
jgi:hypothetical protein